MGKEQQTRSCRLSSSRIEQHQMGRWRMVCHQQRHSWDENFVPHWTLYGLSNKGNNQALTKKKHFHLAHQCLFGTTDLARQTGYLAKPAKQRDNFCMWFKSGTNSGYGTKPKYVPDTLQIPSWQHANHSIRPVNGHIQTAIFMSPRAKKYKWKWQKTAQDLAKTLSHSSKTPPG